MLGEALVVMRSLGKHDEGRNETLAPSFRLMKSEKR